MRNKQGNNYIHNWAFLSASTNEKQARHKERSYCINRTVNNVHIIHVLVHCTVGMSFHQSKYSVLPRVLKAVWTGAFREEIHMY